MDKNGLLELYWCRGGLSASYGNNFFNLRGQQFISKTNNSVIGLFLVCDKPNDYVISNTTNYIEFNDYVNNKFYKTTSKSTGIIVITKLDKTNKIISGRFSGKVENEDDPNDIITVTDGRFDVIYK